MKSPLPLLTALLTAGFFAACGPQTPTSAMLDGLVLAISADTVTVQTGQGDTLHLSTRNTHPEHPPGTHAPLLPDDSIRIAFRALESDSQTQLEALEWSITTPSPYRRIQGRWGEPNPIDPTAIQGFTLHADGTAASIGMSTLRFATWNIPTPNTLILTGESLGNGQTLPVRDTLTILRLDPDSLVLGRADTPGTWRLRRQQ